MKPAEWSDGKQQRAMVAMSGGVDSSVAAYLMQQQGYCCTGVTMRLYDNDALGLSAGHTCCSLEDVEDARAVAYRLGMRYYVLGFQQAFRERVMEPFAEAYLQGCTPNPCIACNQHLKFHALLERARVLGFDRLATGHYARIEACGGLFYLKKALDPQKDQSYFLYTLTQRELRLLSFPLGGLRKSEVRAIAQREGLCTARKHDSQDLCFAPDGDYAAAVSRITCRPLPPGNFVSPEGKILGAHRGLGHYTIGQRRGLGIGGGEKLYVMQIRPETGEVVLGPEEALWQSAFRAGSLSWTVKAPEGAFQAQVKLRSCHRGAKALITPQADGSVKIFFDTPQRAAPAGQAAVFYDGDTVLGGGVLLSAD